MWAPIFHAGARTPTSKSPLPMKMINQQTEMSQARPVRSMSQRLGLGLGFGLGTGSAAERVWSVAFFAHPDPNLTLWSNPYPNPGSSPHQMIKAALAKMMLSMASSRARVSPCPRKVGFGFGWRVRARVRVRT